MVDTFKKIRENWKCMQREADGCGLSKERQARMAWRGTLLSRNRRTTVSFTPDMYDRVYEYYDVYTLLPNKHILPTYRIFHVCMLRRLRT